MYGIAPYEQDEPAIQTNRETKVAQRDNPAPTQYRVARFMAKVKLGQTDECWTWTGGTNEHGYGVFWNGARLEKAHRFSLRASGVEVPADLDVMHSCDNPACVNPAHLKAGATLENVNDMWAKGRATVRYARGTAQPMAKLNDDKASEIRALYKAGGWKQRELAEVYGVSQRVIWNVVNLKTWRNESGVVYETGRRK